MVVSFTSLMVSCAQRFAVFSPILADCVATAVFNRVTSQKTAQFAGCAAGGGALYLFLESKPVLHSD
jgi:hypothetical protein